MGSRESRSFDLDSKGGSGDCDFDKMASLELLVLGLGVPGGAGLGRTVRVVSTEMGGVK